MSITTEMNPLQEQQALLLPSPFKSTAPDSVFRPEGLLPATVADAHLHVEQDAMAYWAKERIPSANDGETIRPFDIAGRYADVDLLRVLSGKRHGSKLSVLHSFLNPMEETSADLFAVPIGEVQARLHMLAGIIKDHVNVWVTDTEYAQPAATERRVPLLKLIGVTADSELASGMAAVVGVQQDRSGGGVHEEPRIFRQPAAVFYSTKKNAKGRVLW